MLSSQDPAFAKHVQARTAQGVNLIVNVLGEAILSDAEAAARLAAVRARLARPDVNYVSVKISALCANLDPLAFDDSVDRVSACLRLLYRDAMSKPAPAFVNLDMEEFKDLALTVDAFTRVLDEPEFETIDAGIVLQAYLPDSHAALDHLGAGRAARHLRGGGRIKVRLVKGANLAMEHVDAEVHGWKQAPYYSKADVDASYKALLESALRAGLVGCRARRSGQSQPVRHCLGLGAARRPDRSVPDRVGDAGGNGTGTGACGERRSAWPAVVRPGGRAKRRRLQHRVPVAPTRREHVAGELPALAVHASTGYARVRRTGTAVPCQRGDSCVGEHGEPSCRGRQGPFDRRVPQHAGLRFHGCRRPRSRADRSRRAVVGGAVHCDGR